MKQSIAVIGDGAMGTVCALLLAENGHEVRIWSAFPEQAAETAAKRENVRFLPGVPLPEKIEVTGEEERAFAGADVALSAVPTQFIRAVWTRLANRFPRDMPVFSVAKGIENGTLQRPSQILREVLDCSDDRVAVLSGPSIAPEIAARLPATVAAASANTALAERVQALIARPYFRVYTNPDLVGVELAGATKNVIAIAAGILDGMGSGCNAKAALLTRGLAEITRLGLALGALPATFAGLAGVGDLVTTCISLVGRNRSFGEAIGRGRTVEEALAATRSVVEGVATTASVIALAARTGVEMPITEAVNRILFEGITPSRAIDRLMTRPPKAEC
ncbi:MAG: NAD(P)-dependent glycerol-3-phosphate dehydrogenase [Candidatus Eisenbacteria bacterium]|nr:NAD(P)-dependent glycerol-3-phosphate dehydrogenase [Candidatus Eisenbacteria bacterium]